MNSPSDLETADQFLHDNPDIEVIEVLLVDLIEKGAVLVGRNGDHR